MSYHPLMGVTFFLIVVLISYYLGRKVNIYNKQKKTKNVEIHINDKKEKNTSEVISPDASWLD